MGRQKWFNIGIIYGVFCALSIVAAHRLSLRAPHANLGQVIAEVKEMWKPLPLEVKK
jgi:hypothetical protein